MTHYSNQSISPHFWKFFHIELIRSKWSTFVSVLFCSSPSSRNLHHLLITPPRGALQFVPACPRWAVTQVRSGPSVTKMWARLFSWNVVKSFFFTLTLSLSRITSVLVALRRIKSVSTSLPWSSSRSFLTTISIKHPTLFYLVVLAKNEFLW